MKRVLAVAMLWGCGGAPAAAVRNRGGSTEPVCEWPARIELAARRYANLDRGDPAYDAFTVWRIVIAVEARGGGLRGTAKMTGDDMEWTFPASGTLDCGQRVLSLSMESHEPMIVRYELDDEAGSISSIDDVWLLGPRFPDHRP